MAKRKKESCSRAKVAKVMHEFKAGTLHSGRSKATVTNSRQGVAIALSEARRKCGGGGGKARKRAKK